MKEVTCWLYFAICPSAVWHVFLHNYYFYVIRNFGEEATIYAGDMKREDSILEWLLVQKDPTNEAIEEHDGAGVHNVAENSEAVAVYICKCCLLKQKETYAKGSLHDGFPSQPKEGSNWQCLSFDEQKKEMITV